MKYQIIFLGSLLASITSTEAHGGAEPAAPHAAPQAHAAAPQMHMAPPAMHAAPQMHMAAAPAMHAAPQMHMAAPAMHAAPQMHMAAPAMHAAPQMHMAAPAMHASPQMHMAAPSMHSHPQMHTEATAMHAPSQMHAGSPRMHEAGPTVHASSENHMASAAHNRAPMNEGGPHEAAARMHEAAPGMHEGRNQEPGSARVHEAEAGRAAGHEAMPGGPHEGREPAGRQEANMHGTQPGKSLVAAPHAYANPRHVGNIGKTPPAVARATQTLPWARGAAIPRAGAKGIGRPGAIDPGGYIRSARGSSQVINNGYMHQQLAAMAGFSAILANNNRFRVGNWNQWPGHWRPGPGWNNLGYYPNYWWNGNAFPGDYFAPNGFCPTPYLFDVGCGQFWQPGAGYFDYLPDGYNAPITVSVMEVVPEYDAYGNIVGYHPHRFRYNAFWDPNAQAYGYYDYRGAFQWVTFPGLNSWSGSQMVGGY